MLNPYRNDFPILQRKMHGKPLIYFDSAATAQKPVSVINTLNEFYSHRYGTVHRSVYELAAEATEAYSHARSIVQRFLNAERSDEIIFTRGTTESINLVAYSFGKAFIRPGDEILISEMEHHSNIVPWQIMAEDRGAVIKVIPITQEGELDFQAYSQLLTPRVKIVAITHVSNFLGTINPVQKIVKMAHDNGSKVLLDGAQAAPHLKIDLQEINPDFYVFSGHKNYGPTGIGVLYGKATLLEEMPPYQGGGDMIEHVSFEKTTYNVIPTKFEAGTPIIAEAIGLGAALDYIHQIGVELIHQKEIELLKYATSVMQNIQGLRIYGNSSNKSAIISFNIDGLHHLDLGTMLDLRGIAVRTGHHCTQPAMKRFGITGSARISFGLYNTKDEVDYFIKSLNEIIEKLS